ncbi:MAG TPA: hypothetical protein VG498_20755 [Terriglobales bacterium]|nr:hypothetical protein [Terriglobales bacterium]
MARITNLNNIVDTFPSIPFSISKFGDSSVTGTLRARRFEFVHPAFQFKTECQNLAEVVLMEMLSGLSLRSENHEELEHM